MKYNIIDNRQVEKTIYCSNDYELSKQITNVISSHYIVRGEYGLPIKDLLSNIELKEQVKIIAKLGYTVEQTFDPLDRAFMIIDEIKQELNIDDSPINEKSISIIWNKSDNEKEFREGIARYLKS